MYSLVFWDFSLFGNALPVLISPFSWVLFCKLLWIYAWIAKANLINKDLITFSHNKRWQSIEWGAHAKQLQIFVLVAGISLWAAAESVFPFFGTSDLVQSPRLLLILPFEFINFLLEISTALQHTPQCQVAILRQIFKRVAAVSAVGTEGQVGWVLQAASFNLLLEINVFLEELLIALLALLEAVVLLCGAHLALVWVRVRRLVSWWLEVAHNSFIYAREK